MKWRFETQEEIIARRNKWRLWFAWYPVACTQSRCWVWLERVYKREHAFYKYPSIQADLYFVAEYDIEKFTRALMDKQE